MATATVFTEDSRGRLPHQLEVGINYVCRITYGIIVIDDTMRQTTAQPIGTYDDGNLIIMDDSGKLALATVGGGKPIVLQSLLLFLKPSALDGSTQVAALVPIK